MRNIGRDSAFVVKLLGVLMCLKLVRNLGTMHLILECDNKGVVEAIRVGVKNHRHWNLLDLIQQFLSLNWVVEV